MAIYAQGSDDGDFERVPPGPHAARCSALYHIGTQPPMPGSQYENWLDKVIVRFEVAGENGGKALALGAWYTLSLGAKANLRRDLEGWRGRQFTPEELAKFDIEAVLGAPCMLNVTHNDKGRESITGIMPMPKGMPPHELTVDPVRFSVHDSDAQMTIGMLPEWVQKFVMKSVEWGKLTGAPPAQAAAPPTQGAATTAYAGSDPVPAAGDEDFNDPIPF